jgi:predicted secreted protein
VDENDEIMQWLRERWKCVEMIGRLHYIRVLCGDGDSEWTYGLDAFFDDENKALLAAKAFTEKREREIAEAREDVRRMISRRDEMKQRCSSEAIMAQPEWFDIWASDERILALVQAHLATLLAGWRTDADERKEAEDVE